MWYTDLPRGIRSRRGRIRSAPLLVIQGSHDTRCPPRQMIAYEEKMKAAGKDITIEWFEAGHGSGNHHQFHLLAWIN